MDTKFRGKVINALRKLTFSYPPRNYVKNRQKVAPATFQCQRCKCFIYEGKSQGRAKKHAKDLGIEVKPGKTHIDHVNPVVPIEGFKNCDWDWNIFMMNLFCHESNLQLLCSDCHKEKTMYENELRKVYREKKKLDNEEE